MRYVALGDSLSANFGQDARRDAPSRFAAAIGAEVVNLAFDGCTTVGLLDRLDEIDGAPDMVTLTVGGSDLAQLGTAAASQRLQSIPKLAADAAELIADNLDSIFEQIAEFDCPTLVCTVYDPIAAGDLSAQRLRLPEQWGAAYVAVNSGIEALAAKYGFSVCDVRALFTLHGEGAQECWIESALNPTASGAAALAESWRHSLGAPSASPS